MTTAVVTGANRGIGLELCRQLRQRGVNVISVCRTPSDELRQLGARIEPGVDVTSDESVQALSRRLEGTGVDLLINNAGVLMHDTLEQLDFDQIRQQFEINTLGPLRVTRALLGKMKAGSKVGLITSRMGSIADNSSGAYYGYRISKAALNMVGSSLAQDLKGKGIAVAIIHPGYVRTGMTDYAGHMDPPEAARGILARLEALTMDNSGSFWHSSGERLPW